MKPLAYPPTFLILAVSLSGPAAAQQQHPPQACHSGELWSNLYGSNSGGAAVEPGDFVQIVSGQTVVLDEPTVELGGLWVDGILVFDHTQPTGTVELRTAYAVVTGTLQIGCKIGSVINRFTKKTHLTLIKPEWYSANYGLALVAGVNWPSVMATRFGTSGKIHESALDRGLVIAGTGRLFIYGNDSREQGWTTLATTVDKDTFFLPFSDPLAASWKPEDEIVIASTDFEYADQWVGGLEDGRLLTAAERGGHLPDYVQGEEHKIQSLDTFNQGATLHMPLDHKHWSEEFSATFGGPTATIEERAEIGNLTRSVVIRGELSEQSSSVRGGTRHSGHVILVEENGAKPYCEVDWAEFRNLGVEGKLGRYPFHWHMLGNALNGSNRPYLRDCSIHHCLNRFVTVHNTTHVDVERNVGWDTLGAGFFLEDANEFGAEIGNEVQSVILRGNLGMKVGRPTNFNNENSGGYPTAYKDLEKLDPPVFWIQHPNQIVEGNHAAGAAGHGFYLAPNQLANGFSHPSTGESSFKNNVAHSNGQHGFYFQSRVEWDWQSGDAPAGEGLVAWKNRRYGIWWRTHGVALLQDCKMADNRSGFYPASGGRQDAHDGNFPPTCRLMFDGGVIFGETSNTGEPAQANPAESSLGRSLPQTYWHFRRPEVNASGAEKAWGTLNAVESYDGRNVITNLKVAYFPDARTLDNPDGTPFEDAVQVVAAITQTEYNSRYIEDPRNDVLNVKAASGLGQEVYNLIGYRTTGASLGHSMIRNTVVFDQDNSFGYGAQVYVCYNDLFFEANATAAGTVDSGRNLLIVPSSAADFAQFDVSTDLQVTQQNPAPQMTVTVNHHVSGVEDMVLSGLPSETETADYGFNAPIGLGIISPASVREGVYRCDFGGPVPGNYEIKIQFAEGEGLKTIIGIPLAATPTTIFVNLDDISQQEELTIGALLSSNQDDAFFFDSTSSPPMLYVRTTTVVLGPNGLDLDGTRNVIKVNR